MIVNRTFLVSCLCMLVAFGFTQRIHSSSNIEVIEKNLDKFPYKVGNFVGNGIKMEDAVIKELNTDVYVNREYLNDKCQTIFLYIGYYGTKKGGRTGHNPGACYSGSGWSILDKTKINVSVEIGGKEQMIVLNALDVKKGAMRDLVYHWYQSNGDKILSDGIHMNIHRFKSKILHNRNDGAFVRVSAEVMESFSYTENSLRAFTKEIIPLIAENWPEESEL